MKQIFCILFFSILLGCKKSSEVNPKNYLSIDGKIYPLKNAYYIDFGYSKAPFDMYQIAFLVSENDFEYITTNENQGTNILIQLYTPGEIFKNGSFVINGPWKVQNAYANGTLSVNSKPEEFEIESGTVELKGDSPKYTITVKGESSGKKITINYSGVFIKETI